MTSYHQLLFTTTAENAEIISEFLSDLGSLAVSLEETNEEEIFQLNPDETPLWQKTAVRALFAEDVNLEHIIHCLQQQFNHLPFENLQTEIIPERNWVAESQKNFPPLQFGHQLWICPSWCESEKLSGHIVQLDPGVAFGTGTHATTALCLEWLAENPPSKQVVIDYGCGSGILALAALALGAEKVWAVDHDRQALEATQKNACLNKFAQEKINIYLPEQLPPIQAPLVIANILALPLISLAPTLTHLTAPQSILLLSGILSSEIEKVFAAYQNDFALKKQIINQEWAGLVLVKK